MTYRKFKADYLFTGSGWAGDDTVLILSHDGIVQSILPLAEAGEGVEHHTGLLSPGFVNCHCHLELSHMKGLLPEKTGLVDFLLAVIRQRNQPPAAAPGLPTPQEWIRSCIAAAEQSMLDNGIVAVGDICNTTDTLPEKAAGRLYYHSFIETIGFIGSTAAERFAHSRKIHEAFAPGASSIVPHAPYSVSPELFQLVADLPGNDLLTIHNQESEAENDFYRSGAGDFRRLYQTMGLDVSFWKGTGKRSLESYLPHFHPRQSLILVHNVATSAADGFPHHETDLSPRPGTDQPASPGSARPGPYLFFCLCPNANLYIGGQLPNVEWLLHQSPDIVLGTDSLASNHQLSILEEIKTLQRAFPDITTTTLLKWATSNGARALQQEKTLGNFLPGNRPGVVLIDHLKGERLTAQSTARRLI